MCPPPPLTTCAPCGDVGGKRQVQEATENFAANPLASESKKPPPWRRGASRLDHSQPQKEPAMAEVSHPRGRTRQRHQDPSQAYGRLSNRGRTPTPPSSNAG